MFYIRLMFSRCISINTIAFLAHITARLWLTNHHISFQVPIFIKLTPKMHHISFDCHLSLHKHSHLGFKMPCTLKLHFWVLQTRCWMCCVIHVRELFSAQLFLQPQHEYSSSLFSPDSMLAYTTILGSRHLKEVNASSKLKAGEIFWLSTCRVVRCCGFTASGTRGCFQVSSNLAPRAAFVSFTQHRHDNLCSFIASKAFIAKQLLWYLNDL